MIEREEEICLEGYIFICDREYRFVSGVELERLVDSALAGEEE